MDFQKNLNNDEFHFETFLNKEKKLILDHKDLVEEKTYGPIYLMKDLYWGNYQKMLNETLEKDFENYPQPEALQEHIRERAKTLVSNSITALHKVHAINMYEVATDNFTTYTKALLKDGTF